VGRVQAAEPCVRVGVAMQDLKAMGGHVRPGAGCVNADSAPKVTIVCHSVWVAIPQCVLSHIFS
jgi:hypothetical protein